MLKLLFKHFLIAPALALSFLWPHLALATNVPVLTSPPDNATVSKSPKLTWDFVGECISSGSCFLIEIDSNPDFKSPQKSSYTNSNSYSPQGLNESNWYWRVKAKDKSEKWSDWGGPFKFIISSSPVSSPSNQTPPPADTSQKTKEENLFEFKNAPSEINSDQEFEISVNLKLTGNKKQIAYLKGAFKKSDSSNYFGQTFFENNWVKNNEKSSQQFKVETDDSGSWQGNLKIKPDIDDSGFEDTGEYILKIARYSETGSGPFWSNEAKVKINKIEKAVPSIIPDVLGDEIAETEEEAIPTQIKSRDYEIKIASVAGEATMSNNTIPEPPTEVLEERDINWFLILAGFGVLGAGIGFVYYKTRKEKFNVFSKN